MRKNNGDDFLAKFGERVEKIGKDGFMGLMKNTGSSINNNYQNGLINRNFNKNLTFKPNRNFDFINQNYNSPNILKNDNIYQVSKPSYLYSQSNNIINYNDYEKNNQRESYFPLDNYFMEANKNRKSISSNNNYRNNREPLVYSCQINNKNNQINKGNNIYYNNNFEPKKNDIGDNRQNILDNGYKPYTIKDYKKIKNEIEMGKLGANLGTKEWTEKKERMKKMSEYGKQIMIRRKENHIKNSELFEEKKKDVYNVKIKNEKGNDINEYSRGNSSNKKIKFKANSNEKLNHNLEYGLNNKEENEEIIKPHININYRRRLNNLKNILF